MVDPKELQGQQNIAQDIASEIKILGMDKEQAKRAKEYAKTLSELVNQIKAFAQRLQAAQKKQQQEQAKAQQGNGKGDGGKVAATLIGAATKAKVKEAEAKQKMAHRDAEFKQRLQHNAIQLAVYRLAWAQTHDVPVGSVRAAFHYVRSGRTVMPPALPRADELAALLEAA